MFKKEKFYSSYVVLLWPVQWMICDISSLSWLKAEYNSKAIFSIFGVKQCWLVWGFVLSFFCSRWIYLLSFPIHIIVLWGSRLRPFILLEMDKLKGLVVSTVLLDHSFKNKKNLYNWTMYNCLLNMKAIVRFVSLLFCQTQHNTRNKWLLIRMLSNSGNLAFTSR